MQINNPSVQIELYDYCLIHHSKHAFGTNKSCYLNGSVEYQQNMFWSENENSTNYMEAWSEISTIQIEIKNFSQCITHTTNIQVHRSKWSISIQ